MNNYSNQVQSFTTLEQLQAFHNERFIRLAYLTILERELDSEELDHWLRQINEHKISSEGLLIELRRTNIGKAGFPIVTTGVSILEQSIILDEKTSEEVLLKINECLTSSLEASYFKSYYREMK